MSSTTKAIATLKDHKEFPTLQAVPFSLQKDNILNWDYHCELEVRDYEIDMQGIVHHSVYMNYLEHCRNGYVKTLGIDIHQYHKMGYDFVIASIEMNYKSPLFPGEQFIVTAKMRREGQLKIVFHQEIRRVIDNTLILTAKAVSVCINANTKRPCMPETLEDLLIYE